MKKRYLFLIFIICLFAVSAVSAAEISNETNMVANDDSSLIVESVNEDTLSVSLSEEEIQGSADNGTFTALQKKINKASEGSIINLENNYAYDGSFSKEGITFNKTLTINGNGYTIDGKNNARIFNIFDANVTLKNINFINGFTTDRGGAISKGSNSNLVISDCSFFNNTASYSGGAIYCYSSPDSGYSNISNCIFVNNSANRGGAIYDFVDMYETLISKLYVVNCSFVNNSASYGGVMYGGSAVNCNFSDNHAFCGGAMCVGMYQDYICGGHAVNCNFFNNTASSGGAMYGCSALNCSFVNNSANSDGGAIRGGTDGYYIIRGSAVNCSFFNNTASSGGAIYDGSAVNCSFFNNTASSGGAIYDGSAVNCSFVNNSASYGGAIYDGSAVNCSFVNNSANRGGAIYVGIAVNCSFVNNSANSDGGAICFDTYEGTYFSEYTVNCIFVNNSANRGGAIYLKYLDLEDNRGIISNSIFINNTANNGSSIFMSPPYYSIRIELEIYDSYFYMNKNNEFIYYEIPKNYHDFWTISLKNNTMISTFPYKIYNAVNLIFNFIFFSFYVGL